ncbi:MAG TPA: SRPBCC family protein [Pyrinomonadaceae bacterium]|nr:SRPBCC family protein [Pyrinomonadaceae bacterium]
MDTWEVTFDEKSTNQLAAPADSGGNRTNVGKAERIASAIGGGALIGYALVNRSKLNTALGLLGAALLYRGASGQCEVYRALGVNTANTAGEHTDDVARDVHIEKSITINESPATLYQFWRNFENLPRFMEGLESVRELDAGHSHWVANGPGGKRVEWDAEIYNEKENELIAWRSIGDADITNAGSVHFEQAPGGRGTYVKVTLNYNPPGGKAAQLFAKLFGSEPGQLVEKNLKRLKQLVETGEIPTIEGQTSGREQLEDQDNASDRKANKLANKAPVKEMSRVAGQEVA